MRYLDTFNELENWKCDDSNEQCLVNYGGQQFQENSGAHVNEKLFSHQNKVLFCHDMRGGYLDDAIIEKNENVYAYRFYYWNLIDIFVYFSHHFISIPPMAWIYNCHRNGVQCLGTFIVEGDKNENFSRLFAPGNIEMVAQKLTDIKNFYNFEGWLINIECAAEDQIREETVGKILLLLSFLVQLGNQVCWYDSITTSGILAWQNGLNECNKPFYDICGNIFLNYGWDKITLDKSIEMAQGNIHNVFVGVDCFGRGCYGGGQLKCNLALEMIEKVFRNNVLGATSKFSIALFAPGWCYEIAPRDHKEMDKLAWLFYNLMEKYLHPWLDGRTIYRQLPELHIGQDNSFSTNFDIGQGFSLWRDGVEVTRGDYNRLMDQNLTPTGKMSNHDSDIKIKIFPYRKCAYNGHSCMIIVAEYDGQIFDSLTPITIELFRMACVLASDRQTSLVLVLGRNIEPDMGVWDEMRLVLHFSDDKSDNKVIRISLNEMRAHYFVPISSNIEWNIFEISSLFSALQTKSSSVTIRKISIEIDCNFAMRYMTKKNIYLGQLALKHKYN